MTTPTKDASGVNSQENIPFLLTRCYIHPERRAVSNCSICRRGICASCKVTLNGKNLCKPDAGLLQRKAQPVPRVSLRRNAIVLASILAFLNGLAGTVVGFLLIVIGLLGPQAQNSISLTNILQPFFNYFENVFAFPSSQALDVGLFAFVISLVNIMTGVLMLRRSRIAAIISVIAAVLGVGLIDSYLVILALAGSFTYVHIVTAITRVILIAVGWKYLDES